MRIVVIGATSAIAEHCCRLWVAREACDLVLVARDAAKAGRVAEDLRVRSPASTITVVEADFLDTAAIGRLADETAARPDRHRADRPRHAARAKPVRERSFASAAIRWK